MATTTETTEAPKPKKTRKPAKLFSVTALTNTATDRIRAAANTLGELSRSGGKHFPKAGPLADQLSEFLKDPMAPTAQAEDRAARAMPGK